MYRLIYVSSATKLFSDQDLIDLLKKAREKNQHLNITGMLLYKDGNFLQVLEGEATAVKDLYHRISQDPRHHGTIVINEEEVPHRLFNEWTMGFRNLTKEVINLEGYSKYMNRSLSPEELRHDPSGCLELLKLFRGRN